MVLLQLSMSLSTESNLLDDMIINTRILLKVKGIYIIF